MRCHFKDAILKSVTEVWNMSMNKGNCSKTIILSKKINCFT